MFIKSLAVVLLSTGFVFAAQQEMVSIPKDQLTEQQKAALTVKQTTATIEQAHGWVGLGKEVGEAVNSSLGAITTQADNFSKTGVGKLTVALVVWKVLGDQAFHFVGGLIELLVFLPIFLWSYRRMCMTRRVRTSTKGLFREATWQVVEYDRRADFTPRIAHGLVAGVFSIVWLVTVFSY